MVGPQPQDPLINALLRGLRELGYVYGEHFVTEARGGEGKPERFPGLATELVRLQVDVIVASGPMLPVLKRLLGDLERLKALLWQRLAATAVRANAMDPPPDDVEALRHLTPHQVAELLSIKPAYVHELCRTRRLPAMKSGKYWMISVAGLRRWLMVWKRRRVAGQ